MCASYSNDVAPKCWNINWIYFARHHTGAFVSFFHIASRARHIRLWIGKARKNKKKTSKNTKKRKRNAHHSIRHINRRENRKNNQIEAKTNTHENVVCVCFCQSAFFDASICTRTTKMYVFHWFVFRLARAFGIHGFVIPLYRFIIHDCYKLPICCCYCAILYRIMNASHQLRNATTQRNIMHRMELLVYKRLYAKDETSQRIHHMS